MKKIIYIFILLPLLTFSQQTYVPDDVFEQYLINIGADFPPLDDYVYTSNISGITTLDFNNLGVSDLTGIEDMPLLAILQLENNPLGPTLDFSMLDLDSLEYFSIGPCNLTSLTLGNLPNLKDLVIMGTYLTNLDISGLSILSNLSMANNIGILSIGGSGSDIDISQNPNLRNLSLINCGISSLDVSYNPNLKALSLSDPSPSPITTIDLSNNVNLFWLLVTNQSLNFLDLSNNTKLRHIEITNNPISSLDVCNLLSLRHLSVGGTNLSDVDVSNNDSLEFLAINGMSNLVSLNLKSNNQQIPGPPLHPVDHIISTNNPNLVCVQVQDAAMAFNSYMCPNCTNYNFDSGVYFDQDCNYSSVPCVQLSWDCVNGNCVDPGTGNGAYSSLSACQFNCLVPVPTWDCVNGNCVDPGTGNGNYSSLSACQSICGSNLVFAYDIHFINIYPNPSDDIFNIEFSSLLAQDIQVSVLNAVGEVVFIDNLKSHLGVYHNQISLKEDAHAVYFLKIQTREGTVSKKLILQ